MDPARRTDAQLSISLPTFGPEDHDGDWQPMLDMAVAADVAGVDRLLVSDHVAYGEHLEAYARPELGGVAGGRQPTGPDGHWLEPLTTLAVIAGLTTRIRLATNILQAALRRPIVLAKSTATLDVLSGGRLDLGVGVGWQREEYDAAGLDFDGRGRLLDETLTVLQAAWRDRSIALDLPEGRVEGIHQMPKPAQAGGVPIWVSGRSNKAVVRRLARFGQGWIPWGDEAAQLVESIPAMKAAVTEAGGDGEALQVCGNIAPVVDGDRLDVAATMRQAPPLLAVGLTDVRVRIPPSAPRSRSALTDYLGQLVAAFHELG